MTSTPPLSKRHRLTPSSPEKTDTERLDFLNLKKIYEKDQIMRVHHFDRINNPLLAVDPDLIEYYQGCQDRLNRILSQSFDIILDRIPDEVQTFDSFCEKCPEWKDTLMSYLFFRDDPKVKEKLSSWTQRGQQANLCSYIHSPTILQHNLVSMFSNDIVGTIDISRFIRDTFTSQQLQEYIFSNKGGSSINFLEMILIKDCNESNWISY